MQTLLVLAQGPPWTCYPLPVSLSCWMICQLEPWQCPTAPNTQYLRWLSPVLSWGEAVDISSFSFGEMGRLPPLGLIPAARGHGACHVIVWVLTV